MCSKQGHPVDLWWNEIGGVEVARREKVPANAQSRPSLRLAEAAAVALLPMPLLTVCVAHLSLLLNPQPPMALPQLSRRAALSSAAAAALAVSSAPPALARPEGVNKPELLPKEQTNVMQMAEQRFLTSGQVKALDAKLTKLQEATGIKLRVLCQQYPNTPGLAIKDYWQVDDNSIIMVVDKGSQENGRIVNILNYNVGENVKLALPNQVKTSHKWRLFSRVHTCHHPTPRTPHALAQFWTKLQNTFGNNFFVRENGEDVAILRAIDTIDYCLRDETAYCVDVPLQFKDPSKAMYGAQDPATKALGVDPGKDLFDGISKGAEKLFGA